MLEMSSAEFFTNVAYAVISMMVMFSAYTLLGPIVQGDKVKKRIESVSIERDRLKAQRFAELDGVSLRRANSARLRDFAERFSLEELLAPPGLKEKMTQAGLRGPKPIYYFYIARIILPVAFGILGFIYAFILRGSELSIGMRLLVVLMGLAAGYYLPSIYVRNAANKRLNAIMPVFPDALDLLLICVESGMSVELSFAKVAEEMSEASIELAEEFSLTTAELSYLNSKRLAYENLARRNNHEGIRSVSTALVQAERYGTPLGETLRVLSDENRQMRVLAAEKKAAALPAKLTVPMMLFFLPVLFIVLLTPAAMRISGAF